MQDLEPSCAEQFANSANGKKHSLKTVMDGEMPSRSHCPTHASMERMLNREEEIM